MIKVLTDTWKYGLYIEDDPLDDGFGRIVKVVKLD